MLTVLLVFNIFIFAQLSEGCSLVESVSISEATSFLKQLDTIASQNDGNRAAGTTGYQASVNFVSDTLKKSGYSVNTQHFTYKQVDVIGTPTFKQVEPIQRQFAYKTEFVPFIGTASTPGILKSTFHFVPNGGCKKSDYNNFPKGKIAFTARGECPFTEKETNAAEGGAAALGISNNEPGLFNARMEGKIPTFGMVSWIAEIFKDKPPTIEISWTVKTSIVDTMNVIAETTAGDPNNVIVVGSHLDGVPAGAGINDNGSGSSTNLEIAVATARCLKNPRNKIRFAFWAGEELGLLGSTHYVKSLTQKEKSQIALNLNFDMLGSPNYIHGIYNGSMADEEIREKSVYIQKLFEGYYRSINKPFILTPFNGRSDYGPFIENGIPAGGMNTGAEKIKTAEQRTLFKGVANAAYDPCYHQYCDNIENINFGAFEVNLKGVATVVERLAMDPKIVKKISNSKNLQKRNNDFKYTYEKTAVFNDLSFTELQ